MTDSTPKVHRRHHGGRPCSCRLRSRRERLRSPTPHDKTSYRSRIRNSRTNRQEMTNIPLLVGNAKRQTTDLDCLIDLAQSSTKDLHPSEGWHELEKQFRQRFRKAQAAQCRSVIALSALALLGVAVALPTAASAVPTAWPRPPTRRASPYLSTPRPTPTATSGSWFGVHPAFPRISCTRIP